MTPFVHALAIVITLWSLFALWRAERARDRTSAMILGVGIVLRAAAGCALFAISLFGLPLLSTLQSGGGFWNLAPDARVYYRMAADAASGVSTINSGTPSPAYIRALAWWFDLTGVSPATAVLFNVVCFAAAGAMLVRAPRRGGPLARVPLVAITFAPLLVLDSTQVLKDAFFASLVVVVASAAPNIFRVGRERVASTAASTAVFAIALAFIAGIRAYYAVIVWCATAVAAVVAVARSQGHRLATAARLITVLSVLWVAFAVGAADYYVYYSDLSARATGFHFPTIPRVHQGPTIPRVHQGPSDEMAGGERGLSNLIGMLVRLRGGFIVAGGATSLTGLTAARALEAVKETIRGTSASFVPISILKAASLVRFSGGRGFLVVTDIDTVFMDLIILLIVWQTICNRRTAPLDSAYVVFAVLTATVSTILLAYVVTNFGTLVRLRLMAALPLWMLPLGGIGDAVEQKGELRRAPPNRRPEAVTA